ncbi:MAG: phenylalanine--tRNA ligase beta subunit-related protein [Candidatus Bathyarchaeia archaeon]
MRGSFPDVKVAVLEARDIVNKGFDPRLEDEKRRLETYVRVNYRDVKNLEVIKKYDKFFRKYGKVYPIRYQIESILGGRRIPSRSTVVEAVFMAELKNMFLTACHDLDTIKGNLETKLTDGTATYVKINKVAQRLKPGDIVTTDSVGIISSVLYGPDYRTRITANTRNILLFSYFPYGEDDVNIKRHFNDMMENIKLSSDVEPEFSNIQIFHLQDKVKPRLLG